MGEERPVADEAPPPPLPGPLPGAGSSYSTAFNDPFQFQFQVGISTHESQLPSGPDLELIERYCPGATNRLISMQEQLGRMVEREQGYQHEIGRDNSRRKTRGQQYAFAAFLICMAIVVWAAAAGHELVAQVIGGATVVGIVSIFVAGRALREEGDGEPAESDPS